MQSPPHAGPRRRRGARAGLTAAVLAFGLAAGAGVSCNDDCTKEDALELYRKRIEPMFDSGNPSSCNECHLQGVDLALFAQADSCTTMACMVDRGVVDLDAPEDSLVLSWIQRATPNGGITEDSIAAEHDAMTQWIDFNARCGSQVCGAAGDDPCGDPPGQDDCAIPASDHELGPKAWEDPGDCSDTTLEGMFQAKVYAWRGRCSICHFSDSELGIPEAPRWLAVGECTVASLETMRNVLERGLVDFDDWEQSLLLLKPLAEDLGGVEHGGDDKFFTTDEGAYLDFRAWIERYVGCKTQ